MNLWATREQALLSLCGNLRSEAEVIEATFALLDENVQRFQVVDAPFARVCGLTLIKARNLALGSYSLMLDGLAQEAGALLRLFIETLELLTYFRTVPNGVETAANGNLPSAGNIAKS